MNILADNPSGRLYKALVDSKKAAQLVGLPLQLNDPGMAIAGAILNRQDSVEDAKKILLDTIDNLAKEPPTKEEVDRARTRLLANVDLALRNSEKVEAAVKEELEKAIASGFTPDEVSAAKSGWLQSRNVGRATDGSLAATLATRDYDDETMAYDADLEAKVAALTLQQIQDALRRHLNLSAMSIFKAGDFKKTGAAK